MHSRTESKFRWTSASSETERRRSASSLADDLNNDLALAWTRVELHQHDLLPCAKMQLPLRERDGNRRPQQRRADVARAVVVAPPEMMPIRAASRRQRLEQRVQIVNRAR